MLLMDHDVARRLEIAEATIGASFVDTRARIDPGANAQWQIFDGIVATYDGATSPFSQTFGLGLLGPVTAESLQVLEQYFERLGAPPTHEVCPLADIAVTALLVDRGYVPIEHSTMLVQQISTSAAPSHTDLVARRIVAADVASWIETSVQGWSSTPEAAHEARTAATLAGANAAMHNYVVEQGGLPIATGSIGIHGGIALVAGASTLAGYRGLGAQALLVEARLAAAAREGCDLAMVVTNPGSPSQRNVMRRGFQVAYTRTKWRRMENRK